MRRRLLERSVGFALLWLGAGTMARADGGPKAEDVAKPLPSPEARTYVVGLAEDGFVPFSFASKERDEKRPGIFMQILNEVGELTGDRFEIKFAPNNRLKSYFERGLIAIEPGINPAWRPEQQQISTYTEPFADLTERLLFHEATGTYSWAEFQAGKKDGAAGASPGRAPFIDPAARLLGTVRGYFYPKLQQGLDSGKVKRVDAEGERAILRMLEGRRVDAVVIAEIPARYYLQQMQKHGIVIGDEVDRTPIMFRVHKTHEALRQRIDKALVELKRRGRVDEIIRGYVGG